MSKIYQVKVTPKNPNHLFYNEGSKGAFTFNGEENKVLKLVRGCTYQFSVNAPTHPLFFTRSPIGGSEHRNETLMGKGESPTDIGILNFQVRNDLPKSFYYQCWNHPKMGGKVYIIERSDIINCLAI